MRQRGSVYPWFDVAEGFCLLPFTEKYLDTFFALHEHVADIIGLPVSHKTVMHVFLKVRPRGHVQP